MFLENNKSDCNLCVTEYGKMSFMERVHSVRPIRGSWRSLLSCKQTSAAPHRRQNRTVDRDLLKGCGGHVYPSIPSKIRNDFFIRTQRWMCALDRCHLTLRTVSDQVLNKGVKLYCLLVGLFPFSRKKIVAVNYFRYFFSDLPGALQGTTEWTSSAASSLTGARCRTRWGSASWSCRSAACVRVKSPAGCASVMAASAKYWPGKELII